MWICMVNTVFQFIRFIQNFPWKWIFESKVGSVKGVQSNPSPSVPGVRILSLFNNDTEACYQKKKKFCTSFLICEKPAHSSLIRLSLSAMYKSNGESEGTCRIHLWLFYYWGPDMCILMLSTLRANSADDKLMLFFLFLLGNTIRHNKMTICMQCQSLFSGKT